MNEELHENNVEKNVPSGINLEKQLKTREKLFQPKQEKWNSLKR